MNTEIYAELKSSGKQQPVFEGLNVRAELRETLAVTAITQFYSNPGRKNIEMVYTFPLPLDAVLLDMTVTLGDKTLKGTVLPKQEAEARYEDAITDGDAPVMLQNPQPGVYTMNVGNLLPGEKAQITIRYGIFMRWQGDTLRYHLPTTIAPRYGSAERAGLDAHQVPETSIEADNLFKFEMTLHGTMAGMAVESPSHQITVERGGAGHDSTLKLLQKSGHMDRDLVITVRRDCLHAASVALVRDGDGYMLWGSFQPRFGLREDAAPRSVKIVVDCSGSMGGDSIAQAREALFRILDELRPHDWFNIVAFGSSTTTLFNAQTRADGEALGYARGFLKKLDADMGGTEIGAALEKAVRLRCPEKISQDVLLITDGEIWEWEKVVINAVKSKHRFFTVGVGSAVSEAFVRTLAERTGGACELVTPGENMAERIHRHFKRVATPRSTGSEAVWPVKPLRLFPVPLPAVYDGDTVNIFAWFAEAPAGRVQLQVRLPDGAMRTLEAPVPEPPDAAEDCVVARMAAALRLREIIAADAGRELAVKYQLVSRWTNYLAVVVRDERERADSLPELHSVQQMQAAGWGGMGSMKYSVVHPGSVYNCCSPPVAPAPASGGYDKPTFSRDRTCASSSTSRPGKAMDMDYDIATFLRRSQGSTTSSSPRKTMVMESDTDCTPASVSNGVYPFSDDSSGDFIAQIEAVIASGGMPATVRLPLFPAGIAAVLGRMVDEGIDERTVMTVFLQHLAGTAAGRLLSRQSKRVIARAYKNLGIAREIIEMIEERLRQELGAYLPTAETARRYFYWKR